MNDTFLVQDRTESAFSQDSLVVGDSTRSLLTPLYASDYESYSSLSLEHSISEDESTSQSSIDLHCNKRYTKILQALPGKEQVKTNLKKKKFGNTKNVTDLKANAAQCPTIFTKSWEEWLIDKALVDLKKLQIQKELKQKQRIEKKKELEAKKERDKKAEENRVKWLSQKGYEYEKKKKEEAAEREYKRLKKQQQQEIISNKAKQAYHDWAKKKEEDRNEMRLKEKKQKHEIQQKQIERKELNEVAYKEWKQKLKLQQKENQNSPKLVEDDSVDYYQRLVGPSPTYVNPVPWKGTVEHQMGHHPHMVLKGDRIFQSPPLLWKDYEQRKAQKSVERRTVSKNSYRTSGNSKK